MSISEDESAEQIIPVNRDRQNNISVRKSTQTDNSYHNKQFAEQIPKLSVIKEKCFLAGKYPDVTDLITVLLI